MSGRNMRLSQFHQPQKRLMRKVFIHLIFYRFTLFCFAHDSMAWIMVIAIQYKFTVYTFLLPSMLTYTDCLSLILAVHPLIHRFIRV